MDQAERKRLAAAMLVKLVDLDRHPTWEGDIKQDGLRDMRLDRMWRQTPRGKPPSRIKKRDDRHSVNIKQKG